MDSKFYQIETSSTQVQVQTKGAVPVRCVREGEQFYKYHSQLFS